MSAPRVEKLSALAKAMLVDFLSNMDVKLHSFVSSLISNLLN